MNQHKALAICALEKMKSDDTARARATFRNLTSEQMNQQYGESGKTPAEIIASYVSEDAQVEAAINWVKSQQVAQ